MDAPTTPYQKHRFEKWYPRLFTPLFISPAFLYGICAGQNGTACFWIGLFYILFSTGRDPSIPNSIWCGCRLALIFLPEKLPNKHGSTI
jgi:hypothetical protein